MKHHQNKDSGARTMRPAALSLEAHASLRIYERLLALSHGHVSWGTLEPHVRTFARRQGFVPHRGGSTDG